MSGPRSLRGVELAYADWSNDDYENFHDAAFDEIFNQIDWSYFPDTDMEAAEELFERGWLNFDISEQERESARYEFSNLTNIELDRDDWEIFRELYEQADA